MKQHTMLFLLLALALCLLTFAASGEGVTLASFFPAASYYRVDFESPDGTQGADAVFYEDGSIHGVTDALEETYGYYAVLPDGSLLLDIGSASFQLEADENGAYSGRRPDNLAACFMTPIARSDFDAAAAQADLYVDLQVDRVDVPQWDYPVYVWVTAPEGIDLLLEPSRPELITGHLPEGAVMRILGQWFGDGLTGGDAFLSEYDVYLLEADGVRGFALSRDLEEIPVRRARVVRSSSKDKGRTVNVRKTPDYGDNIILEVPYGEMVEVFPVVEGEFTRIYYDYCEGWMTTVRLQIIDE